MKSLRVRNKGGPRGSGKSTDFQSWVFLEVQWLSPMQGFSFHLWSRELKIRHFSDWKISHKEKYCNKFKKDFVNGLHQKINFKKCSPLADVCQNSAALWKEQLCMLLFRKLLYLFPLLKDYGKSFLFLFSFEKNFYLALHKTSRKKVLFLLFKGFSL